MHPHRFTAGDPELLTHQVHPVHQFGDGVFNLDSGIHFQEVKAVVVGQQELAGAGAAVAHGLCRRHRGQPHALAQIHSEGDRRGLLNQFLMSPLDRAFAFPQMQRALVIGQDLDFDVPRPLDELLQVHVSIAERLQGLRRGRLQGSLQRPGLPHHPHPLPSPTSHRLHHHGISDLLGQCSSAFRVLERHASTGHDGHACLLHPPASLRLVAHRTDGRRRRAHPDQLSRLDCLGKRGALGQEAIAGMHRVGAGLASRGDEPLDGEIAFGR